MGLIPVFSEEQSTPSAIYRLLKLSYNFSRLWQPHIKFQQFLEIGRPKSSHRVPAFISIKRFHFAAIIESLHNIIKRPLVLIKHGIHEADRFLSSAQFPIIDLRDDGSQNWRGARCSIRQIQQLVNGYHPTLR